MMKKWMEGLTSNESESMTMREGKIRETYELSLQKMMPKMIESTKEKRENLMAKMEEDHKVHIAELEARAPGTPEADKEARA